MLPNGTKSWWSCSTYRIERVPRVQVDKVEAAVLEELRGVDARVAHQPWHGPELGDGRAGRLHALEVDLEGRIVHLSVVCLRRPQVHHVIGARLLPVAEHPPAEAAAEAPSLAHIPAPDTMPILPSR